MNKQDETQTSFNASELKRGVLYSSSMAPVRKFSDRLIDVIPFIDPDTTRMVEWIWAIRQTHGLSTSSYMVDIPDIFNELEVEHFSAPIKKEFPIQFESNSYFRAMDVPSIQSIEAVPTKYCVIVKISNEWKVVVAGDPEFVSKWSKFYRETYRAPDSIFVHQLIAFGQHGPLVREKTITKDDEDMFLANDAFYPWLEGGIDKLVHDYLNSNSSAMLFIGEPGTGKSTLIRTLFHRLGRKNNYLCSDENALMNENLVMWLETIHRDSFVALEDADNLIRTRDSGNPQMSMLLNFTDGVVSHGQKLVISTNLEDISKVDRALTRPGRMMKTLQFRLLTPDEANAARVSIGKEEIDFKIPKITLSEALNFTGEEDEALEMRRRTKTGFLG